MRIEPSVWQVATRQWMVVTMAMVEEFVDGTIPAGHHNLHWDLDEKILGC